MTKVRVFLALVVALVAAVPGYAFIDLDKTTKSLFLAGRCMAPVMLREAINTKDLREMPAQWATAHLYGKDGRVWHGADEAVVLVELSEGASCGINVFDEDLEAVQTFMSYWMDRDDSPFTDTSTETLDSGDVRISYDGFCESCGFHVHARALWLKEAKFTIYRVFATLPEKT